MYHSLIILLLSCFCFLLFSTLPYIIFPILIPPPRCLGMHIFGGKFCTKTDGSREPCSCEEQLRSDYYYYYGSKRLPDTGTQHNLSSSCNNTELLSPNTHESRGQLLISLVNSSRPDEVNSNKQSHLTSVSKSSCRSQNWREDKVPCVCDRKNFNNFLWATVTVFQVRLTREGETKRNPGSIRYHSTSLDDICAEERQY